MRDVVPSRNTKRQFRFNQRMKPASATRLAVASAAAFLFFTAIITGCKKKGPIPFDPAFANYISAYTTGTISVASPIRVRLTDAFKGDVNTSEPVKEDLLDFSPSIEGELWWLDNQTLEFRPKAKLERGKVYEGELKLDRFIDVPSELRRFRFAFVAMKQHVKLNINEIKAYRNDDLSSMYISGTLATMDVCDEAALPKTIQATEDGRELTVNWTNGSDPHFHHFTVDSVLRGVNPLVVSLKWNGESIDADQEGSIDQNIPALGDFSVMHSQVIEQPEQFVKLHFSDPLEAFIPEGLIELENAYDYKVSVDGNEVYIYPPYRMSGFSKVIVHPGVKNIMGYPTKEQQIVDVEFEEIKPEVKIDDMERVILPSTDGLVFPFQAVSLSAVDVRVMQIFENNVPQFLQVNDLHGSNEMRRVGRVIKRKTVQLNPEGNTDLAVWNTFYLDLNDIMKTDPGAIYRVEIGFKKAYSLYHCTDGDDPDKGMQELSANIDDEFESTQDYYWDEDGEYGDYFDGYYDYYDYDYDWSQRENPCSDTYYSREPIGKNILASDLGIIAKKGNDKSMLVTVSDLVSTKLLSGVEIEVLNYQQQVIQKAKTDGNGICSFERIDGVPYLVVAKQGKQRGYLKVDGGHAQSLSTFDVSGDVAQKGLKGFIYGERGVWRPGDTLFLSFMLEDEKKVLPAIHPVNFELMNPRGQIVQKMVKSKGENGFFSFTCKTDDDAPTGDYHATVRVGGAVFSKSLKVETIKPNRLKLQMDFGNASTEVISGDISAVLGVKWLHGAVAKNLKANVSATFTQASTYFEKYPDFVFSDPIQSFYAEEQTIFDGSVNQEGKANVSMKVNLRDRAPGMLKANFSVKVFEEGGDFSVDRFSSLYAPYNHFVGIKTPEPDQDYNYYVETDKDQLVKVVTVNPQGKPEPVQGLVWNLYKVSWRWWWERNGGDLSNYVGSESTVPVSSGSFNTGADGKGQFNVRVNYPEWGRYLVRIEDPSGGHATGSELYFDWPATQNRNERVNPDGANVLAFTLDKTKYNTGDECVVTIPGAKAGRAFVSVETGSRVVQSKWIQTKEGLNTYSFKTTEEMSPNAYVYITLVQPHNQTANDLPIRLYGVVPLFVENPNSHLSPVISMKDELAPEQDFEVKVSESSGKAMTYTLEIVDDGLLDLTRFKTPDPWNHFYAREALGVNTYDMYDQVIGAYGSKLEKLLSLGGDAEVNAKAKNRANRFKPVVMHAGPFTIEKGKSKTHKFKMPNYVGSVRVMVVAGKDMAYGNAEKAVPVKKPLMVLASLPRVLGPGEEVKLPVTVFAMDQNIRDVNVKVEANDLFSFIEGSSKSIHFNEPGDDVVNFPMRVNDKVGVGKVKVTVTGGSHKSTYEVEMKVRNPNPVVTNVMDAVVDAGASWDGSFDLAGMDGTNQSVLEISAIPPVDFGKRLKYLLSYPHGCVEQTTSAAFPQLFLSDVMDLNEAEIKKTTENIKAAINQLAKFQTRGGGMGYWPGDTYESEWGTSYSGHFMLEAKKKGYSLPPNWENAWISYQQRMAQNWMPQDARSGNYYWYESDLSQAYRLYTLALAGKPEMGAMNRMKERNGISLASRWRLAAAYAIAGQPEAAKSLINGQSTIINPYVSLGYTYGSNWRDEAMIIETLSILGERTKAAPLVLDLAKELSSNSWYSTQTVAYGLIAMAKFSGGENGKNINYSFTLNGKSENRSTSKPISSVQLPVSKLNGNAIQVKNSGSGVLYVRILNSGQPAVGNETAASNNLYVQVNYTTMNGAPINAARIEQGTDFIAEVSIWNPGVRGRYDELALSQIFPSGWEIINQRMDLSAAVMNADNPDYRDVRDDRVYSYFDLSPNQTRKFRVKLNATYLGKYYLPAVNCEAMYDHSINGRVSGQWVEVVSAGGNQTAVK
jgi:uncharacterized protein YfaS (alpha-2-macroglobulin family)